jgi:hypothetical protein
LLTIKGTFDLFLTETSRVLALIISHPPYESCAPVENHFIKYFYGIEIVWNEWSHFGKVDYYQEGWEVHEEELGVLVVLTKSKHYPKQEPTAQEYSRQEIWVKCVCLDVEV